VKCTGNVHARAVEIRAVDGARLCWDVGIVSLTGQQVAGNRVQAHYMWASCNIQIIKK